MLYGVTMQDEGVSSCSPSMSTTCTRNLKSDRKEMRMGLFDKIKGLARQKRASRSARTSTPSCPAFGMWTRISWRNCWRCSSWPTWALEVSENIVDALRRRAKLQRITTEDQPARRWPLSSARRCRAATARCGSARARPSSCSSASTASARRRRRQSFAYYLKNQGKKSCSPRRIPSAPPQREQLAIWAERVGVDIVRHNGGRPRRRGIRRGVGRKKARGTDVIICDTAGRLHNKST